MQLKVSLLGQDDVRYFSVFDGFSGSGDPLTLDLGTLEYKLGTAGRCRYRSSAGAYGAGPAENVRCRSDIEVRVLRERGVSCGNCEDNNADVFIG